MSTNRIIEALNYIPVGGHDERVIIAFAIKSEIPNGFDIFDAWYRGRKTYNEKESLSVWKTAKPFGKTTIGTLFYKAKENGWDASCSSANYPTREEIEARNKSLTEAEKKADKDRAKTQQEAARKARWILGECELTEHKYIQRKGFKEHPVNVWQKDDQQLLIVPMYHQKSICGCQIINEDGEKRFLSGQRTSLAYFKIGDGKQIFLVEGFSKGLAAKDILASIGCQSTIYVTFSVGNATKMAKYLPTAYWLGDNDENCVGQNAAEASGLRWWIPNTVGFGIDDAYFAQGKLKTGMQIKKFLMGK